LVLDLEPRTENGMMASEGNQIEGGLAIAHGIPLLVVAEKNILKRGILDEGAAEYGIVDMNTKDPTFKSQVAEWCEKVKARPRVFLGYCGKAQETAEKLIGFLQQHEVSVREYKMDFVLGSTILDQIDRAARGLRPVF
jgi:hypothetical protein